MKTACYLFLLLFSILSSTKIYSQDQRNYLGVKGGISIPNLTAGGSAQNPLSSGYSSRQGPDFALFYETRISQKFSVMPQLEYSSQGAQKNGFQALPIPPEIADALTQMGIIPPPYLYADFNNEIKLNYLMLSALAKFNWRLGANSPASVYVDAGPFAGLLVSAHDITSGSSIVYLDEQKQQPLTPDVQSFDNDADVKDQLHTGNFGITGDIGLSLDLKKHRLFVEGGGNYGFLNIQKGTENGENHTGAATIRVGYAYNFGKIFSD